MTLTAMDVALFVPCYVDQLYPGVGQATATVLRRAGCTVHFDARQTCCGQPMANSGCGRDAAVLARRHLDIFQGMTTVCPSGSCTSMVKNHYAHLPMQITAADKKTQADTHELSHFLVNILGVTDLGASFPHTVAVHQSCHGLRELNLGRMSERMDPERASPAETLLNKVAGITLHKPARRDECCGFGGTFAVTEPALSVRMGEDRLDDLGSQGAEYMVAGDMSCLMHLDGIRCRRKRGPKAIHLAEILASR